MMCQHKAFLKLLPKGHFEVSATDRGCGSTKVFHFIIILTAPSPLKIPLVQVKVLGPVHEGALLGVRSEYVTHFMTSGVQLNLRDIIQIPVCTEICWIF